jgi:hypothetical protein
MGSPQTPMSGLTFVRVFAAVVLAAVAAVASAPRAGADDGPPAAVNQYVEVIPTGSGGAAVGATKKGVKQLPKKTSDRLKKQAGADSELLEKVATQEEYGAPQQSLSPQQTQTTPAPKIKKAAKPQKAPKALPKSAQEPKPRLATGQPRTPVASSADDDDRGTIAAGFDAASDPRMLLLLALLAVSSVAVIGARAAGRRSR